MPAVVAAHTGKQPVAVDTKAHRPRPAATGQSQCGGNKVVRGRSQGGRNKVVRGTSGAATEISMAGIMQNLLLEVSINIIASVPDNVFFPLRRWTGS